MMKKINVIVIDSGINKSHKIFSNCSCSIKDYSFYENKLHPGTKDDIGHGTAICGIISKVQNINITSIKINSNDVADCIDESDLIHLLEYIYINLDADIINISMGITICTQYDKFYNICQLLSEKKVIIISAFDNAGAISYPAAFENTIGVITGQFCYNNDDFEFIEDKIVNIAAKGNIQRVAWTTPEYLLISGNSFACAHVTAKVALLMLDGLAERIDILTELRKIAKKQYSIDENNRLKRFKMKINKAVLFPFNKEMHGLVRFKNLLSFEITDIYDSKYSAKVGATTQYLLKDKDVQDFTIKNIETIDWNSFDTLILGHMDELSSLVNKNELKKSLIDKSIIHNKQVYAFDDLSDFGYSRDCKVYWPKVGANDLPANRFGMLYRISKPIVGIFGTSSCQGKFTLQLKLREILMKQGYNVGQIGTEPSSLLYGMDYVYPMGYNSSVYVKEYDAVRYLNYITNDLCMKNYDVILIGSQSGTVPYDTGNIIQFNVPQYTFLMGTQPDCVVLCINPYDEIEYIERTLNFIESSVECKVISIVIYPMDIKNDWTGMYGSKRILSEEKYRQLYIDLANYFDISVFKLGNENDMMTLSDLIINFFAE